MLFEDHIDLFADLNISGQVKSIVSGVSPMVVTSRVLNINFNADLLDDEEGSYYLNFQNFTGRAAFSQLPQISPGLIGRYSTGTGDIQQVTLGSGLSLSSSGVLSASGVGQQLTAGNGILGDPYDGSAAKTWALDFGTGVDQVARGNHNHDVAYRPISWTPTLDNVLAAGSIATTNPEIILQNDSLAYFVASNATGSISAVMGVRIGGTPFLSLLGTGMSGWGFELRPDSTISATISAGYHLRAQQDPIHANDLARKAYVDSLVAAIPGTVTSVSSGNLSGLFTTLVSNATSTPSISYSLENQSAYTVFARGSGNGAPSFQALVADHIPDLNASKITTGTLPVARGGTGAGTLTGILVGNGTSAITAITGSSDQLLRRNTANTGYEFFTHDFISSTLIGANNGIAPLDASGKIPSGYLPVTGMQYKGTWDASTNTPTLSDATGQDGWYYRVTDAGTQNLGSGNITFSVGDDVIHNGVSWERAPSGVAATNLSVGTRTNTTLPITNSNGTGFSIPLATGSLAGIISGDDYTKLQNAITGNQTITISGAVNGSGATSIVTTFRNSAALSVIGRSANSVGVPADITAGTDGHVLRRSGTSIGFGLIGDSSISSISWSKLTGVPTTLSDYGIQTEADNRYVNTTGDTMTGMLTVKSSIGYKLNLINTQDISSAVDLSFRNPTGDEWQIIAANTGNTTFGDVDFWVNNLLINGDPIATEDWVESKGYITSASIPPAQTLSFDSGTGSLSILSGNSVSLDDRYISLKPSSHTLSNNASLDIDTITGTSILRVEPIVGGVPAGVVMTWDAGERKYQFHHSHFSGDSVFYRNQLTTAGGWRAWYQIASREWADSTFYTKTISDGRYVNTTGDTMTGTLNGTRINLNDQLEITNPTAPNHRIQLITTPDYSRFNMGYGSHVTYQIHVVENGTTYFAHNIGDGSQQRMVWDTFKNVTFNVAERVHVAGDVRATGQLVSTVASGTAPISVNSNTLVSNLNADLLDGQHGSYYLDLSNSTGTLPAAKGGTGLTSLGTAGQMLKVNAGGTALEYFTPSFLTSVALGDITNVTLTSPSNGQVLTYNGTSWVNATPSASPTNYVTTDTNQTGIAGNKTWTGGHIWAPGSNFTPSVSSTAMAIGRSTSGIYLQTFDNDGVEAFAIRSFNAAGGIQLSLLKGGISTASHGTSANWLAAYNYSLIGHLTESTADGRYISKGNYGGDISVSSNTDASAITYSGFLFNSSWTNAASGNGFLSTIRQGTGGYQTFVNHTTDDGFYWRGRGGGTYRPWMRVASREWTTNTFYSKTESDGKYVPQTRTLQFTNGAGLTVSGTASTDLSVNRTVTYSVNFGTSAGTVAQGNDSRINNGQTAYSWGNHASAGYVPQTRELTFGAGDGLSVSGTSSINLSVNRNVNYTVNFGTGSNQVARGNHNHDGVYVPTSRTITINGVTQNLSDNRSWTISAGVTGSGSNGYIARWNSGTGITNSELYQSGSNIGIGTTSPADKLTINGTLGVTGDAAVRGTALHVHNNLSIGKYDSVPGNRAHGSLLVHSGDTSTYAHVSAALEIRSTTKALLLPRQSTTQWDNIGSKPEGLFSYDTTDKSIRWFTGTETIKLFANSLGFWVFVGGIYRRINFDL